MPFELRLCTVPVTNSIPSE